SSPGRRPSPGHGTRPQSTQIRPVHSDRLLRRAAVGPVSAHVGVAYEGDDGSPAVPLLCRHLGDTPMFWNPLPGMSAHGWFRSPESYVGTFLRRWFRSPAGHTRRRSVARRLQRTMLLLEALEDRTVPSVGVGASQWSNLDVAWRN